MTDKKILGSVEITGVLNPNDSGLGLSLPNTSSFSETGKTLATVEDENASKVSKTLEIAGINLQDDITREELLTALDVESGSQENVIESIKVNSGSPLTITSKTVDIPIPKISTSDITLNDTNHSSAKKLLWNSSEEVISKYAYKDSYGVDIDVNSLIGLINTSISTNTANFLGTYNLIDDLELTRSATPAQIGTAIESVLEDDDITATSNDYVFIEYPDDPNVAGISSKFDRYKYNGSSWEFEYTLNNSSYTESQWNAITSGITSALVQKITNNESNKADKVEAQSGQTLTGHLAKLDSEGNLADSGIAYDNVALQSGNNVFTGNNTHSGTEIFSNGLKTFAIWGTDERTPGIDIKQVLNGDTATLYNLNKDDFYSWGTKNLGKADKKWGNLYLSGNLSDGTNSISIAHIEDNQNKVTSTDTILSNSTSDTKYPTVKAVVDYVDTYGGKIDSISINNDIEHPLTIDANKNVDITIPTKVSDLTNDGDGDHNGVFTTKGYVDNTINKLVTISHPEGTSTQSFTGPTFQQLLDANVEGKIITIAASATSTAYKYYVLKLYSSNTTPTDNRIFLIGLENGNSGISPSAFGRVVDYSAVGITPSEVTLDHAFFEKYTKSYRNKYKTFEYGLHSSYTGYVRDYLKSIGKGACYFDTTNKVIYVYDNVQTGPSTVTDAFKKIPLLNEDDDWNLEMRQDGVGVDGNLYVTGNISDGTNSFSIAHIANNSFLGAPEYDPTSTYAVGDRVLYQNRLYSCTTAIETPEEWDSTHWTEINLNDYVDLSNDQSIGGTKTFTGVPVITNQVPDGNNIGSLGNSAHKYAEIHSKNICLNGTDYKIYYDNNAIRITSDFLPSTNATKSLGSSDLKWVNGYFTGNLSDGTNSITVAQMTAKQNAVQVKRYI